MRESPAEVTATETRRLAALRFTDIVGFSRQMGTNDARMLRLLEVHNGTPQVEEHCPTLSGLCVLPESSEGLSQTLRSQRLKLSRNDERGCITKSWIPLAYG